MEREQTKKTMIRKVDRRNYYVPIHGDRRLHYELEWHATDNNTVLGAVILDKIDFDFSWVVLTKQEVEWCCVECGTSHPTFEEAKAMLFQQMEFIKASLDAGRDPDQTLYSRGKEDPEAKRVFEEEIREMINATIGMADSQTRKNR
jgi:hypothetical protein